MRKIYPPPTCEEVNLALECSVLQPSYNNDSYLSGDGFSDGGEIN